MALPGRVVILMLFLKLPAIYSPWVIRLPRSEVFHLDRRRFYIIDDVTRGLENTGTRSIFKTTSITKC